MQNYAQDSQKTKFRDQMRLNHGNYPTSAPRPRPAVCPLTDEELARQDKKDALMKELKADLVSIRPRYVAATSINPLSIVSLGHSMSAGCYELIIDPQRMGHCTLLGLVQGHPDGNLRVRVNIASIENWEYMNGL